MSIENVYFSYTILWIYLFENIYFSYKPPGPSNYKFLSPYPIGNLQALAFARTLLFFYVSCDITFLLEAS